MEQYGLVLENKGETAVVNIQRHAACSKCGKCGLIGGGSKGNVVAEVLNPIKAQAGQRVLLESDDRRVIFVFFMLYMVPLAGLVTGILLWLALAGRLGLDKNQELIAFVFGLGLMGIIFFFIHAWDKRVKDSPRYKPVITGLIEEEGPECDEQAESD